MRILNFVVLSVIPHNVLTPHISKTHLPTVSLNVRDLELNWRSKGQSRKKAPRPPPPLHEGGAKLPRKTLQFIKGSSLSS